MASMYDQVINAVSWNLDHGHDSISIGSEWVKRLIYTRTADMFVVVGH